ncbi:MAG: glycosyltransferase [Anaerolineae bacterium]
MSKPQPKRIVRIVSQLNISGPALQAILLTAELKTLGYDCMLVGGNPSDAGDDSGYMAHAYQVEPVIVPELEYRNPLGVLPAIWRLYHLLRDLKPDIVHTHNPRAGFIGRISARLAGVPVVVHTLHEYPFRGYYNRLSTIVFIYIERFGAHISDSIITLSQGLRQALVETYHITNKSRITVLPLGYDLGSFASTKRHQGQFRQAWAIPDDVPLIGIIGRLLPVKNHRLFLDAVAQLHPNLPEARFVIIGDGEEREPLEQYTQQLGIAHRVIFTGWQQQMEMIYSDLDVLVNSSLNEGTPVPIIEALAVQCPVVATDVGGVSDLLDGGALGALVPPDDCDALVQAIHDTLTTPPDMHTAQATMLRRYGIQRLAQDLDSLYRGLFAKKHSHS